MLKKIVSYIILFIFIPFLSVLCAYISQSRASLFISIGISLLVVGVFYLNYQRDSGENWQSTAAKIRSSRKIVLVSVMIALCVIGRFIPMLKPVMALTIITAMYMGQESGFMVGSMTAFISDFYFGIGPWTPFRMFGWGTSGYMAGVLSKYLLKSKVLLMIYGVVSGVIFSLTLDVWSVMNLTGVFSLSAYFGAVITAIPHTLLYCGGNVVFLFLFQKPFGEKFSRIKIKYGL